jgi:hypothetical protein
VGWVEEWVDFGWVEMGFTHNGLDWFGFKEKTSWDGRLA